MYGAFVATVLVCSKQRRPRLGWLTADGSPNGQPLSARQLQTKTQMPEKLIQGMLDAVSDSTIGWISFLDGEVPSKCLPSAADVSPEYPRTNEGKNERTNIRACEDVFSQIQLEIHAHFNRPEGSRWPYDEEHLLAEVCKSPTVIDEWATIRAYRRSIKEFQRKTVISLLQNWMGELDKARNSIPKQRPKIAI